MCSQLNFPFVADFTDSLTSVLDHEHVACNSNLEKKAGKKVISFETPVLEGQESVSERILEMRSKFLSNPLPTSRS
jgi:hypothetical protein